MNSLQSSSLPSSSVIGSRKQTDPTILLESFGKRVDPSYSQTLYTRVKTLLQSSENTGFPGTLPVNFETEHLDILQHEDYFVCEKSVGIRCLLFFVHSPKGPASFLLDRNQNWYFVPNLFFPVRGSDNEYLKDTLMDGELVVDNDENAKSLRFLIFDLMALNGLSIIQKSFSARLGVLQQDVIQPHKLSQRSQLDSVKSHPPFTLELKKMERSYGLHLVFEQISRLRHDSDGVIWTPVKCPYVSGVCNRLLKWKPPEKITVDFKISAKRSKDHKPIYSLNVLSHLTYKFFDYFQPDSDRAAEWKDQPPDGRIAEFRYDPTWQVTIVEQGYAPTTRTGGWRFVQFRDEKGAANDEADAKQIIHSIQEGVSKEQLLTHMEHIRDAWKAREKGLPLPTMAYSNNRTGERASNGSLASTLASNHQSLLTPTSKSPVLPSSAMASSFPNQGYSKSTQNSMDYGSAGRYNSTVEVVNDSGTPKEMAVEYSESYSNHHDQTKETNKSGTQSLPGSRRQSCEVSPKRNGKTKKEDTERKRHKSLTELDRSHRQQLEARRHTHPRMNHTSVDKDKTAMDCITYACIESLPVNNNITTFDSPNIDFAPAAITSPMTSRSLSTMHEEDLTPLNSKGSSIRKQRQFSHTEKDALQQKLDMKHQDEDHNIKHTNGHKPATISVKIESEENGRDTAITPSSTRQYHHDLEIPLTSSSLYPDIQHKDIGPLEKTADIVMPLHPSLKNGMADCMGDNDGQSRSEGSYARYDPTRPSPPPLSIPSYPPITSNGYKVSSPSLSHSPSPSSPQKTSSQSIHNLLTSSIEPILSPPANKSKKELASDNQGRDSTTLESRSQSLTVRLNGQHRQQHQQKEQRQGHHKEITNHRHGLDEQLCHQPHQQQHMRMSINPPYQATSIGSRASPTTHTFPIQFINFHADRSNVQGGSPSSQQKTVFIQGECHSDTPTDQRIASTMHQQSNYPHPWQQTSISEPTRPSSVPTKHRKSQSMLQGSSTSSSPTPSPRRSISGRQLDTWRVTKKPIQQATLLTPSQQQRKQHAPPMRQNYAYERSQPAQVHPPYNYESQQQQQHPYPYSSYYASSHHGHKQHYPLQTYQQRAGVPDTSSNLQQQQQSHPIPVHSHHSHQHINPSPNNTSQERSSKAKLDFILN